MVIDVISCHLFGSFATRPQHERRERWRAANFLSSAAPRTRVSALKASRQCVGYQVVQLRAGSFAAEAGGSVTPRHVRHDATCRRAKDAPTAGVDALPTSLFFFTHRGRRASGVKFERSRHTHPGASYERAARAHGGGRKGRGFASEFELAEVERNSADEVQRRLQRRFCLEKVRPHAASSRLRVLWHHWDGEGDTERNVEGGGRRRTAPRLHVCTTGANGSPVVFASRNYGYATPRCDDDTHQDDARTRP